MKAKHVIFRSKGCRTCRARKVKCDEARPICQRCIRSRFECQGYSEPTTFLSDNPQTKGNSSSLVKSVRSSQEQSIPSLPQALPYPAELTHIAFLVRRLSIGTPGDRKGFSWLSPGLESLDQGSLFSLASRCLAEVYYGRVFRQDSVVANGMIKYGSILSNLRQQLQVPQLFQRNSLMPVILTSVVIESIADQSAAGFHAHVRGITQLVQRAGPQAFMYRPNILIFELCRCWIIGRAIIGKHETFVSAPEWKRIPWTCEKKETIIELWDIISDLPSVAFHLQRLKESSLEGSQECLRILHVKIAYIFQELFNWRWDWERQYIGSADQVPITTLPIMIPLTSSTSTSLTSRVPASLTTPISALPTTVTPLITDESGKAWYSTLLSFCSRERAMEIIYYNATLIFLFRMAQLLRWSFPVENVDRTVPSDFVQPLPSSPLLLPSDMFSLEDASSEFYRSVESCLCITAKAAGDWYQLMFALSLVNVGLNEESLEAVWMKRIRHRMVAMSGLDMWSAARRSI